jgi:hypothetical protein
MLIFPSAHPQHAEQALDRLWKYGFYLAIQKAMEVRWRGK